MATKSEKEKVKAQQDKAQAILSRLLKDEDNKYCVDCDAKGPRWASWNLGIFLCIRCAGMHRNLGAHISKVKSVNLDTWTPEQISMMMEIGNSCARAVYEANIPDGFRRPQSDSSLESFIRSKYEQKKYIAREWIPPKPKIPKEFLEEDAKVKKGIKKTTASMVQLDTKGLTNRLSTSRPVANGDLKSSGSAPSKLSEMDPSSKPDKQSNIEDLLGLDVPQTTTETPNSMNLLNDTFSQIQLQQPSNDPMFGTQIEEQALGDTAQSKKESIMALFGSSNQSQQPYGMYTGMGGYQQMLPGQLSYSQQSQQQMYTAGNMIGVPYQMVPHGYQQTAPYPMQMYGNTGVGLAANQITAGTMMYNPGQIAQPMQYNQMQQQQMTNVNMGPMNVPSMQGVLNQGAQINSQTWQQSSSTLSNSLWH